MAPAKKRARNAQSDAQPSSVLLADYRTAWLLAYVSIYSFGYFGAILMILLALAYE